MQEIRRWIEDNLFFIIMGLIVALSLGTLWLANVNGSLDLWSEKPFAQATMGDIAGIAIFAALLSRK